MPLSRINVWNKSIQGKSVKNNLRNLTEKGEFNPLMGEDLQKSNQLPKFALFCYLYTEM